MPPEGAVSLLLVLAVISSVLLTSLRRAPGLGVLLALIVVGLSIWWRPGGVEQLGLGPPQNWPATAAAALAAGAAITLVTIAVLEPVVERWTGEAHDWSLVEGVRDSWAVLVQLLIAVWLIAATLEEVLFRGFLMLELKTLLGTTLLGMSANLALSSLVFGLAHSYQGRSGVLSTGVVGALLGGLFIASGFNLWLPLLTHGFVDTFSLLLMRLNWDKRLRSLVRQRRGWSAPSAPAE